VRKNTILKQNLALYRTLLDCRIGKADKEDKPKKKSEVSELSASLVKLTETS
jgi:hypothetical protein